MFESIHLSAERKSISIKASIPHETEIFADKYMFSTILRNLLSNAIKFTPIGGEVLVEARNWKNDFMQISTIDNGVGISHKIQSQLFDISKNSSTKGTENEIGTGLGLFLYKEFVEKHNGDIWVESEIDKGSKFSFTIHNGL